MILFHRLTPLAILLAAGLGFAFLILDPFRFVWWGVALLALIPLLFARLLLWDIRRPGFWVFLCMPSYLLTTAFLFFLLLEGTPEKIFLAIAVAITLALYAENLFSFYHMPSTYQAYALEYLSVIVAIASMFFLGSGAYLAQTFLEVPWWAGALVMTGSTFAVMVGLFWVSKISFEASRVYAAFIALIVGELHVALSWLPTGFITNAAVLTIIFSALVSLMRAHALDRWSPPMVWRISIASLVFVLFIFFTAPWA